MIPPTKVPPIAAINEILAPYTIRENKSLPNSSVPKICPFSPKPRYVSDGLMAFGSWVAIIGARIAIAIINTTITRPIMAVLFLLSLFHTLFARRSLFTS